MATIDPFTTEGAKRIAEITGQQPAPMSASILSAPPVPNLPQPTYTPVPTAPAIPTFDDIFRTTETPVDQAYKTTIQKEGQLGDQIAQESAYQADQEQQYDIGGKKKTVNDLTASFNNLKAEADQIPLQIQNDFEGRGATAAGLAPIQTGLLRNNSIRQLGVSAMLNAANGNLATAQDQVDSAVKAKFDPLQAELDAQKAQLEALLPLMDTEQKQQATKQQAALQDRSDALQQQRQDQKTIYDTMLTAAQYGADAVTLRNIQNATTPEEAAQLAGPALGRQYADNQAQQQFENQLKLRAQQLDETRFAFQQAAQQQAAAGNVVTAASATDLTSILGNSKIAAGTKTNLANILGVMSAAETMAKNNPEGKFSGISPLNSLLNVKIPFTDVGLIPFRKASQSQAGVENSGYIDGINLKVQQWASGANLTAEQTKQVARMTPTPSDTDKNVKVKLNNLTNFMNDQIKGALMTEGITYDPPKVDLFAPQKTLADIFNQ